MDAFYASVEQRDDPKLRGKPVAVGGDAKGRGVVAAASYEARKYGVRSAIPMAHAVRLCPGLKIVRPDMAKYKAASSQVFAIFRSVTPLVQGLSLDEAFLDVTENAWNEPLGVTVARRIKHEIREATQLTASAGVAPNKFLAKIASGWRKPNGLTVIAPERVDAFLQKLPVEALWGVGPATAAKLHAIGVTRLVDVRTVEIEKLRGVVGSWSERLVELSHGVDERPVEPHRDTKSSGTETTYPQDLVDIRILRSEAEEMAAEAAEWLARAGLWARTVTLKIRYSDFTTITRSASRPVPTRDVHELAARASALLAKTEAGKRPVRLLGVSVKGLSDSPMEDAPRSPQLELELS
jgi:DNA polymerase-4